MGIETTQLSSPCEPDAKSSMKPAYANFPSHHPHFIGGGFSFMGSEFVKGVYLIVSVGARDFGGPSPPSRPSVPPEAAIVRIGMDTDAMGRTNATDIALVSDAKECLEDLKAAVESLATQSKIDRLARSRSVDASGISSARRKRAQDEAAKNMGLSPVHPDELGVVMAETLDSDAIVVSENLTGRRQAFHFGHREGEMMYMHNGGHALGWGVGAATGAKLGAPDRQVVCSIGDGSVMYSAAGFWTQARYGVPVLTVVWNNHHYQIVRNFFDRYQGKMARAGRYAGIYLGAPDIDFAQLAKSQGLSAERVESGADLKAALKRGIEATRAGTPHLIDVEVARYGGGAESTWHQEFNLAEERTRRV